MLDRLRLSKLLARFEEEVQARIMRLLRLKGLLILIIVVGFGGYWLLGQHIDRSFAQLWVDIKQQWELFSISAALKGAVLWVRKMGIYWVTREIPKRLAIGFALSYGVVYFMPLRKRIQFRDWAKRKKKLWIGRITFLRSWLQRDDVFGPYAGWAIGLLVTLIFLVLFYAFFWIWIIIALGFLKMPWWIMYPLREIGKKLFFILQKIPFGKGLIKFTNVFWVYVSKWLSRLRLWKPKSEEKLLKRRLRQIRITRVVIRQRRAREAAWQSMCRKVFKGKEEPCEDSPK